MNKDQSEIQRKLRILRYAEELGHVAKTCRWFAESEKTVFQQLPNYGLPRLVKTGSYQLP